MNLHLHPILNSKKNREDKGTEIKEKDTERAVNKLEIFGIIKKRRTNMHIRMSVIAIISFIVNIAQFQLSFSSTMSFGFLNSKICLIWNSYCQLGSGCQNKGSLQPKTKY